MRQNKKNILILGAGVYQVPAIKKAKELGYNTIVLSYNIEEYPGSKFADIALNVDTTDIPKVLEVARKYNVRGVFTTGTDVALPALGKVNDELNLVGSSYETCTLSTNKLLMKKKFEENGVPTSRFEIVDGVEQAKKAANLIGYPVMVKATNSSGSRGITKANSDTELETSWGFAKKYSKNKESILIEEFLEGKEFGIQAFIHNKEVKLICVHNTTTTPPPHCVPIGHSYPFKNVEILDEVESICKKGIKALKMNNCAANMDLIQTEDGIKIFEIGARMGGTCIPELIEVYTGIDVTKECIKISMGKKPNFQVQKKQAVAAMLITSKKAGIFKSAIIPQEIKDSPYIVNISRDINEGDSVNSFQIGPDRIGEIIVKGDNVETAEKRCIDFMNQIKIELV
ncbi:ATP-grasp domain-containing protein [Methanosarcina sp. WWM596]|uniref:ATP-grasp domain-containing protein n=1 Tax=Methanosarcina sp. WWM596 TaxID=1434103 RepID=UPI0006157F56|nr:ATP-grasp domain-containing protein [Methanosarcina sp. WWM596]AKB18847.1 Phosphoribosylglycinamide synthetase, ATP-grasp (A) domain protein [Methanosarcina sp. WWM596]